MELEQKFIDEFKYARNQYFSLGEIFEKRVTEILNLIGEIDGSKCETWCFSKKRRGVIKTLNILEEINGKDRHWISLVDIASDFELYIVWSKPVPNLKDLGYDRVFCSKFLLMNNEDIAELVKKEINCLRLEEEKKKLKKAEDEFKKEKQKAQKKKMKREILKKLTSEEIEIIFSC